MRPVHKPRHLVAVLIFAAVATACGYQATLEDRLSDDQVGIASAAVKRHDERLYQHDMTYRDDGAWRGHSPVFGSLMEMMLSPTGYRDIVLPFRVLSGFAVMLYLCGMYALLFRQCRSWSVSAYVAVLSSAVTDTLGGYYWGLGNLSSITPESICLALTPVLVLAFLRYSSLEDRFAWPRLMLLFVFIGLMGNVSLSVATNLTIVLLVALLVKRRFSLFAWPMAMGCVFVAMLMAGPYLWYLTGLRYSTSAGLIAGRYADSVAACHAAGFDVFFPDVLKDLPNLGLVVGILVIPALIVLTRGERFTLSDGYFWLAFTITALIVAGGLHAASQLFGKARGVQPPVIGFLGASALIMPPLYMLLAQALTNLFRMVQKHRSILRWFCVALFIGWMLPADNLRIVRHEMLESATAFMQEADKPSSVIKHRRRRGSRRELQNIAAWARQNTDTGAVFITDRDRFRMSARRSVLACPADIEFIYYFAPHRLEQWAELVNRQDRLLHPGRRDQADAGAVAALVEEMRGDKLYSGATQWYIILRAGLRPDDTTILEPILPENTSVDTKQKWGMHFLPYRIRMVGE